MLKILFICHGNICRSPMAEFVMKDLVKKAGLTAEFGIASAATSTEETGNPQTGETIPIAAPNAPAFKAGKALKEAVNQ